MAAPDALQPQRWHRALATLLLFAALTTARACHHLRTQQRSFAWDSLRLLHNIDPSPPQDCQHQAPTFRFPSTLLRNSHPQQAAATALHILQHLFTTLNSSSTPQHWDTKAQQELLNNLHHYITNLEQCLTANGTLLKTKQGPRNLLLSINKYFNNIQHFLHIHNHTDCAWDIIHHEFHACFQHLHKL
ncbi:IFN protein, partial [Rhinopomastus cyanomelas]|nr:IFN protein [Rhinopomastus cyanomelas]